MCDKAFKAIFRTTVVAVCDKLFQHFSRPRLEVLENVALLFGHVSRSQYLTQEMVQVLTVSMNVRDVHTSRCESVCQLQECNSSRQAQQTAFPPSCQLLVVVLLYLGTEARHSGSLLDPDPTPANRHLHLDAPSLQYMMRCKEQSCKNLYPHRLIPTAMSMQTP